MYRRPTSIFLMTLLTAFVLITGISIHAVETALTHRLKLSDREVAHAMAIGLSRKGVSLEDAQSLIDAHFALGNYQRIRLLTHEGIALYSREKLLTGSQSPKPDTRLFWLWSLSPREQLPAATAAVKQNELGISHVSVQSELSFDHHASELWLAYLLLIFSVIGATGIAVIAIHRRKTAQTISQLDHAIAHLLDADSQTLSPPALPQFKDLFATTRLMTQRIRERNLRALEQVDVLNRMRRTDAATGLLKRDALSARLASLAANLTPSQTGHAFVIHLLNLQALNMQQGRQRVDGLLSKLGRDLARLAEQANHMACGRINGTDIVLLVCADSAITQDLKARTESLLTVCGIEIRMDDITFGRNEKSEDILLRCERNQTGSIALDDNQPQRDAWYERLTWGLTQHHFFLQGYPVINADRQAVHVEHYLRLSERKTGTVHPGGTLMAWAEHLHLAAEIDLEVVNLAFNAAAERSERVCINLSAAALLDPPRREALIRDLQQSPRYSNRIDIDIGEDFAVNHPDLLRQFIATADTMGIRVGIDHLDAHAGSLMQLSANGVRYVKLAANVTVDLLDAQTGRECARLLSELVHSAHALSMQIFAENVSETSLMRALFDLGFDGVSGPAAAV